MERLENWVPEVSPCSWHGEASPARGRMETHQGCLSQAPCPTALASLVGLMFPYGTYSA